MNESPENWKKEFDKQFDVWYSNDSGTPVEGFTENHHMMSAQVKSFISALLSNQKREVLDECIKATEHLQICDEVTKAIRSLANKGANS